MNRSKDTISRLLFLIFSTTLFNATLLSRSDKPKYLLFERRPTRQKKQKSTVEIVLGKTQAEDLSEDFDMVDLYVQEKIRQQQQQLEKRLAAEKKQLAEQQQIERERIRQEHAALLRQAEENMQRQMSQVASQAEIRAIKLQEQKELEQAELDRQAKKEIIQAYEEKIRVLKTYLGQKPDDLNVWKSQRKQEIETAVNYLMPFFEDDDSQSREALNQKRLLLDTEITNTQQIYDEHYSKVIDLSKPILMLHDQHLAATKILENETVAQDLSPEAQQDIERIIFYKLPPFIQRILDPITQFSQDVINENLQAIVQSSIEEEVSPEQITEEALIPLATELREEIALLEKQLSKEQEEKLSLLSEKENFATQIKQLNQDVEKAHEEREQANTEKEKAIAQANAEKQQAIDQAHIERDTAITQIQEERDAVISIAQTEITQLSDLNQRLQRNLEAAKIAWLTESKKQLALKIDLKKHMKKLEHSKLDAAEKERKIEQLLPWIVTAKRSQMEAAIEARKAENLKKQLQSIENMVTTLHDKHQLSQQMLMDTHRRLQSVQNARMREKRAYEFRKQLYQRTREKLSQENLELQQQYAQNARLRAEIDVLTRKVERIERHTQEKDRLLKQIEAKKKLLIQQEKNVAQQQRHLQARRFDTTNKANDVKLSIARFNSLTKQCHKQNIKRVC